MPDMRKKASSPTRRAPMSGGAPAVDCKESAPEHGIYNACLGTPPVGKVPIELESGKLGGPDCECPLEPWLMPFYHKGHKLGSFDGIVCKMCGYGLLTEKGMMNQG